MRACRSCGRELLVNAKFCGSCGAAVEAAAPATCANCGAAIEPGWTFCGACGRAVAGATTTRGANTRTPVLIAAAAVAVLLVAAAAGVLLLRGGGDGDELDFASPPKVDEAVVAELEQRFASLPKPNGETDRDQIRDLIGPPDAFEISWESVGSEPEPIRYETWYYYDLLTAYEFADGSLISNLPIDDVDDVLLVPRQYDPASFDRSLTWESVALMLANPGSAATTTAPPELGIELTAYAADQLLVVFDPDGLVYVEAIPLKGGAP